MSALNIILDEIDMRLNRTTGIQINKVTRARLSPFKDGDLPACNYWVTNDLIVSSQHGADTHELSISIECYDKTYDRPFIDIAMDMHAAITASLNSEIGGVYAPNLGDIIQKLEVIDFTPIIGEGSKPWCGALLNIKATYQTAVNMTDLL